jgi:hypothetical protein
MVEHVVDVRTGTLTDETRVADESRVAACVSVAVTSSDRIGRRALDCFDRPVVATVAVDDITERPLQFAGIASHTLRWETDDVREQ